jgi:hypothetical protein
MKAIFKMMNMRDMENFRILMDLFIKENGNNHYFMVKDMKLVINLNIKELINKDIVKDMEK